MVIVGLVLSYGILERIEAKKLIKTTLVHQLDAGFYIRNFNNIDDTKTLDEFYQESHKTLTQLNNAKNDFNQLKLYTPFAKEVVQDYHKGAAQFEKAITQSQSTDLNKLKQEIDKAEQTLLNSREKLFDLSDRYWLSIELKMG